MTIAMIDVYNTLIGRAGGRGCGMIAYLPVQLTAAATSPTVAVAVPGQDQPKISRAEKDK